MRALSPTGRLKRTARASARVVRAYASPTVTPSRPKFADMHLASSCSCPAACPGRGACPTASPGSLMRAPSTRERATRTARAPSRECFPAASAGDDGLPGQPCSTRTSHQAEAAVQLLTAGYPAQQYPRHRSRAPRRRQGALRTPHEHQRDPRASAAGSSCNSLEKLTPLDARVTSSPSCRAASHSRRA